MGSQGKRRGRRTRSDRRRGARADITRGVQVGWRRPFHDPAWRSIPEGRGLPYTRLYRAMLPVVALAVLAVLAFAFLAAGISMLLG